MRVTLTKKMLTNLLKIMPKQHNYKYSLDCLAFTPEGVQVTSTYVFINTAYNPPDDIPPTKIILWKREHILEVLKNLGIKDKIQVELSKDKKRIVVNLPSGRKFDYLIEPTKWPNKETIKEFNESKTKFVVTLNASTLKDIQDILCANFDKWDERGSHITLSFKSDKEVICKADESTSYGMLAICGPDLS